MLSEPIFEESRTVDYVNEDGANEIDKSHRNSMSAYLPLSQEGDYKVLACIEERASVFQGHVPVENFENLQVVKYVPVLPLYPLAVHVPLYPFTPQKSPSVSSRRFLALLSFRGFQSLTPFVQIRQRPLFPRTLRLVRSRKRHHIRQSRKPRNILLRLPDRRLRGRNNHLPQCQTSRLT